MVVLQVNKKKKKDVNKLLSIVGLFMVLVHNKKDVDMNEFQKVLNKLNESFDGNLSDTIDYIQKRLEKLLKEIELDENK